MGDIASGLGQLASQAGQATGVSNLAGGISDLFTGGGGAPVEGQPGGPELVGPPSPVQSPNFLQGFAQGFMGMQPGKGADAPMGAGGEVGAGLGQLFNALGQLKSGGASAMLEPIIGTVGKKLLGPELAPSARPVAQPSNVVQNILASYTGGLLGSNKLRG